MQRRVEELQAEVQGKDEVVARKDREIAAQQRELAAQATEMTRLREALRECQGKTLGGDRKVRRGGMGVGSRGALGVCTPLVL